MKKNKLIRFSRETQFSFLHAASTVIKLDGTTPIRYGLRLNMDEKYTGLKKQLSELCSLKPEQILLAEVHTSNIKVGLLSSVIVLRQLASTLLLVECVETSSIRKRR